MSYEQVFEEAINLGAKDCINNSEFHEIVTEKDDFYKIKSELEKKIESFLYSAIEWRAFDIINLNKAQSKQMIDVLSALEELDDVQKIFTNVKLEN